MSIASLYPSINPSLLLDFANSKVLDPRITFTRTTTATYYDGVTTAKAEENLLLQSQFAASWTSFNATLTANTTTAPDGTSTAATVVENTANNQHVAYQQPTYTTSATYTFSCYFKAGARNYGMLRDAGNAIKIDLTNGTTTVIEGSPTSHSATSVGNGWYRCVMTVASINNNFQVGPHDNGSTTTYTGNGTGSVYVWGAQLEQRSSATAYTATTTQAITNYIPVLQTASSGQARFDHNPTTGESLGLLIEEARTNVATYSAQFDNAAWTKSGGSITLNGNVAPDGTVSADIFVENTSNSTHELGQAFTINMTSTAYTMSIYVKANGRTKGSILMVAPGPTYQQFGCNFNLTAQTATVSSANGGVASSATITPVGNDWYRITATGYTTYNGSQTFAFYLQDSSGNVVYTGNGFSGMSVWGAQLEAGSFATSYIPTTGSTATRNADAASMTGTNFSSWFNNGEGTLYADFTVKQLGIIADITVSSVNVNCAQLISRSSGGSAFEVFSNGALQATIGSGVLSGKIAGGYKVNDFAVSLNGAAAATDTSGTVPNGPTQLKIGSRYDDLYYPNGTYKKFAYYPIKATSAQLQALTV